MSAASPTSTSSVSAEKGGRSLFASDYLSTTAVTGLNIVATLGVSSLLSRAWSKEDFLLFTAVNRYLSLLYCVVSLSLGFGIVQLYRTTSPEARQKLLANALLIVVVLGIGTTVAVQAFATPIFAFFESSSIATRWALLAGCLWVLGQSVYHVVLSYQRALGDTPAANRLMFFVKTLIVLMLSVAAYFSQSISVAAYYGGIGVMIVAVVLFSLWQLRATWEWTLDLNSCRSLTSIAWSRCLEAILKHALMPILVTLLYLYGQPEIAGGIVVVALLLRGIESLFQPLVLMVMADSLHTTTDTLTQRKRVQSSWNYILLISLPATLGLWWLSEPLLAIWLGDSYRNLAPAFRLISLALPAVLASVLMRGNLESQYRISPLAATCLGRIALVGLTIPVLAAGNMLTLTNVAICLSILYWLQFAVVFYLLRKQYETSLLPSGLIQSCKHRLRLGGIPR